ncbi:unnamed protein product [Heterobilharzia americana]|nr:unnamed protein product [Heterobilharzia americana]
MALLNEQFKIVFKSTYFKGQQDTLEIQLGNVVNPGYAIQSNSSAIEDNDIQVTASVRVADSKISENGTNVSLPIRVKFGSQEVTDKMDGKVFRDGNETLNLLMNVVNVDQNVSGLIYSPGDVINLNTEIRMLSTSRVECSKVILNIYHSMIIKSAEIWNSSSPDSVQFIRNKNVSGKGVTRFEAPGFFFENSITLYLQLVLNEIITFPNDKTEENLTLIVELVCPTNSRNPISKDTCNVSSVKRIMKAVVIKVRKMQGVANQVCQEDLGLSNSQVIQPCQISSFISPYPGYDQENIRSSSVFGWKPFVRPGPYKSLRYLTILFGRQTNISRVNLNLIISTNKINKLIIMGTNDGKSFASFKVVEVSYKNASSGSILLNPYFVARGIRLAVSETENEVSDVAFTLDIYGCRLTLDSKTFDPCSIHDPYNSASRDSVRSYLRVNDYLFYCDLFPTGSRCFVTYGSANMKWTDLGPHITKILTFISPRNIIFAQGQGYNNFLFSTDYGKKWSSTNLFTYIKLTREATSYINSTIVPWIVTAGKFDQNITGTSCQFYQQGSFQFCFSGIYSMSKMVTNWNRVCPLFS